MRGKQRLELALGVQSGRGQQPGVDAHCDLVHNASRVGDAVGGLQTGPGGARRGQDVGHGRGRDQGTRGGIRQKGGLGVRVAPEVGVGASSVVGTAVRQGEGVAMHGWGDVGLWAPVDIISVPFLMAGAVMLDLSKAHGLLLMGLECRGHLLGPVEEGGRVVRLPPGNASPFVQA